MLSCGYVIIKSGRNQGWHHCSARWLFGIHSDKAVRHLSSKTVWTMLVLHERDWDVLAFFYNPRPLFQFSPIDVLPAAVSWQTVCVRLFPWQGHFRAYVTHCDIKHRQTRFTSARRAGFTGIVFSFNSKGNKKIVFWLIFNVFISHFLAAVWSLSDLLEKL